MTENGHSEGRKSPGVRYDWDQARTAYCEGLATQEGDTWWPNLRELSSLLDLPYARLRRRAQEEDWHAGRAAYQSHLEKVRQERRAQELAHESVDLDTKALTAAKIGLRLVNQRLSEIARAVAKKAEDSDMEDALGSFLPGVDARELETLARGASGWHALGRKALGEVETIRQEIVGPDGGPVEVRSAVRAELVKDDPERLYGFLLALERSGLAGALAPADREVAGDDEGRALEAGDPEDR